MKKTIPDQIRSHLEERGTKQIWLANKTNISPEHISNILANRVLLTQDVLDKINNVLGTQFKNQ